MASVAGALYLWVYDGVYIYWLRMHVDAADLHRYEGVMPVISVLDLSPHIALSCVQVEKV